MRKGCLSSPGNLEKQPKIFNLETIHKAFHKYDNIFSQQLIIVKQYCQQFKCFQARCIKSGLDCRFIYVWLYFQAWCSTCLDNTLCQSAHAHDEITWECFINPMIIQTTKWTINTSDGTNNLSSNLARDHPCATHPIRMALLDCMERCNHADLDTGGHGIIAEVDVQSQPWTTPEVFMDVCLVACHSMDGHLIFLYPHFT